MFLRVVTMGDFVDGELYFTALVETGVLVVRSVVVVCAVDVCIGVVSSVFVIRERNFDLLHVIF